MSFLKFLTNWRKSHSRPLSSSGRDVEILRKFKQKKIPSWRQLRFLKRFLSRKELFLLRVTFFSLIFGLVWLGFFGLSKFLDSVPTVGGTYTEAVLGEPSLLNPIYSQLNDVDQDISSLVYSGLFRFDKSQRLVPDLAVRAEKSDDGKTYTITLRSGVKWHDGEVFSAKDVMFTFELLKDQLTGSPLSAAFANVEIALSGENSVVFSLKEPYASFLNTLTFGILPEHVLTDVRPDRLSVHKINLQPIGTGPYKFLRLEKDVSGRISRVELTRNTDYYRPVPFVENFVFRFFSGETAPNEALDALRRHEVDGVGFVPSDLRSGLQRKSLVVHNLELPQYTAIFFNMARSVPASPDVREALALSIDKHVVLREALSGVGSVIATPLLPIDETATGTSPLPDFDRALEILNKTFPPLSREEYLTETVKTLTATSTSSTSTELLDAEEVRSRLESELSAGQTIFRKTRSGSLLEIRLITADTKEYRRAAETIAGFWQEIGVRVILEFIPPKEISRQALRTRNYDALLYGAILGNDPDQYPFWHSSQIAFPGLNLSGYQSAVADQHLIKIRELQNEGEQENERLALSKLLLVDRPAIFLYRPTYTYVQHESLRGAGMRSISLPSDRFADISDWYLKTKTVWGRSEK